MRRSTIGKRLDLPLEGPGLTDLVLSESDDLSEFTVRHEESGVRFMRTGEGRRANACLRTIRCGVGARCRWPAWWRWPEFPT